MSLRRIAPALALFLSIVPAALLCADSRIRCESRGGRRECRSTEPIGRVVLRKQLSLSSCEEGQTWDYTREYIWVDNGCRADFDVIALRRDDRDERYGDRDRGDRDRNRERGTIVNCESIDGRRHFCEADTRLGVRLDRQISGRDCVQGRNWGFNERGIWVDDGCRADFIVGGRPRDDREQRREVRRSQVITCESDYNRRHTCYVDTSFGVDMRRQLSRTECVLNRTWGYDRNGVWVANGCRAEFFVHGND